MPRVSLINRDTAGGTIVGQLQSRRFSDGLPWAVVGDSVESHPPCPIPSSHCNAVMDSPGSPRHFIDGIPIIREGDAASCGHTATGSSRWVSD